MEIGQNKCPANKMIDRKRRWAKWKKSTPSKASDFYFACRNGNINYVNEHLKTMPMEEIGTQWVHAATFHDSKGIVQLLLDAKCSPIILNRYSQMPYEEIQIAEMKKLYGRPTLTRFL